MVDKYGKDKNNYGKPEGYGKGGMIKGYKNGGKVVKPKKKPMTPKEKATAERAIRSGNIEREAEKALMQQKRGEKVTPKKEKGYKCGGKVKK